MSVLNWQCAKEADVSSVKVSAGQGGSLARFAIAGNYLYTVGDQNLTVYDISNPANPVFKKTAQIGRAIETIYPLKDNLFIGSESAVYIYSIADPFNPTQLSSAISPEILRRCDPVVAKDTVAFATLRTNGPCGGTRSVLAVYDIKDITKPVPKASYSVGEPYGLGYSDSILYVCDKLSGLVLFDISDPYNPVLVKNIKDGSYIDVIPFQNTLICWVDTGMILYDITDNANPVLLARIN